MTSEEKVKAREKEARVAELAKKLYVHSPHINNPHSAFANAEFFDEIRQARWEALK